MFSKLKLCVSAAVIAALPSLSFAAQCGNTGSGYETWKAQFAQEAARAGVGQRGLQATRERTLDMLRGIPGNQCRPDLSGQKSAFLHVDLANLRPFGVVEHRKIDRARYAILRELGWGSHVDHRAVAGGAKLR